MARHLDTVYVSGWQCSATASSSNEPSPDLADYPMVCFGHSNAPLKDNRAVKLIFAVVKINRTLFRERSTISSKLSYSTTASRDRSGSACPLVSVWVCLRSTT